MAANRSESKKGDPCLEVDGGREVAERGGESMFEKTDLRMVKSLRMPRFIST